MSPRYCNLLRVYLFSSSPSETFCCGFGINCSFPPQYFVALVNSCLLTPCASCTRLYYYLIVPSPPVQDPDDPCWRGQLSIDCTLRPAVHHIKIEETSLKL